MGYFDSINFDLLNKMPINSRHVLEIGCGEGLFGEEFLKYNPTAKYVGVELNDTAGKKAAMRLSNVIIGSIENQKTFEALDEVRDSLLFDVIVFGDVLEHLYDPWSVLRKLHPMLKIDGLCIACIPNVSHWSMILNQLHGKFDYESTGLLDFTHVRFFTLSSALEMFNKAGYVPCDAFSRVLWEKETKEIIQKFMLFSDVFGIQKHNLERDLSSYQWIICATHSASPIRLNIVAMGLNEIGGVTKARIDYPLRSLNTVPGITTIYHNGKIQIPSGTEPGIFILHRNFIDTNIMKNTLERLIDDGWVIISEIDDDPHRWEGYTSSNFYAFTCVHAITCSTKKLAEKLSQWNENVCVFPNAIYRLPGFKKSSPKNLGSIKIFFGALNRYKDWSFVRSSLCGAFEYLKDRIELVIVHDKDIYNDIQDGLKKTYYNTLSHDEYMKLLASCDVALLPLEDTVFNEFKSDLKFIECCAAGVIPICSNLVYGEIDEHKKIGIFPESDEDWGDKLIQLCYNFEEMRLRKKTGLEYVKNQRMHCHQVNDREIFYRYLMQNRSSLEHQRKARLKKMKLMR